MQKVLDEFDRKFLEGIGTETRQIFLVVLKAAKVESLLAA